MSATFTQRVHYRTKSQIAVLTNNLIESIVLGEQPTKAAVGYSGITTSYAAHLLRQAGCERMWLTPAEVIEIRKRRSHK